jgi:type IV secretory pathway VirB10-like protein
MTDSPDLLHNPQKRGAGVRRLNRWPLVIATMLVCVILGAITYTYQMRLNDMRRLAAEENAHPEPANSLAVVKNAPDNGLIPAKAAEAPPPSLPPAVPPEASPAIQPIDPNAAAWEDYREQQKRLREARNQAAVQAISADTPVASGSARAPAPAAAATEPATAINPLAALLAGRNGINNTPGFIGFDAGGRPVIDQNAAKRDFLKEGQTASGNYLPGGRQAPLSLFEIKAGTIIPAVMVGGVNSDLPGQIIGQVSQNVYDTATGRFILIPQGAKLVGTYDNSVAGGQNRVLAAWTRIIYPDGSSVDLGKMPGTDEGGYAGFTDQVNNHAFRIFGNALLMSVFSAGLQLSQGSSSAQNGPTTQQTMSAALGQTLGQAATQMLQRDMAVQPTLEIRPGYRFNIMVIKDAVLRPWTPQDSLPPARAARAG